jgi:hypothetical protein
MVSRTTGHGVTSDPGMDETQAFAAARHADMRIQVVLRELNQGALAGLGSEISEYAARLIIQALDSFDYQSLHTAWGDGFRAGMTFERVRHHGNP